MTARSAPLFSLKEATIISIERSVERRNMNPNNPKVSKSENREKNT
jgi:hypothetical protein